MRKFERRFNQTAVEGRAWMSDYTPQSSFDVIIHPYPNSDVGLGNFC